MFNSKTFIDIVVIYFARFICTRIPFRQWNIYEIPKKWQFSHHETFFFPTSIEFSKNYKVHIDHQNSNIFYDYRHVVSRSTVVDFRFALIPAWLSRREPTKHPSRPFLNTPNIHKTMKFSSCLFCTINFTRTFFALRIHTAWLRPSTRSSRDRDSVFFSVRDKADGYIWWGKNTRMANILNRTYSWSR